MLRIKDIKHGVPEFGPATGNRGLEIFIENDPEADQSWDRSDPREVPVFKELQAKLIELDLESIYTLAIDGTQRVFLFFRGGDIESPEFAEEADSLFKAISQDSLALELKGERNAENQGH